MLKKGPQTAIMGTVTIVLGCYGYTRNSWNFNIQGGCEVIFEYLTYPGTYPGT